MEIKKMIIKLNPKFYSKEAVWEALKDFENVCEGKILNDGMDVELIPKEDIKNLKEEFCNYVLGLSRNKMFI